MFSSLQFFRRKGRPFRWALAAFLLAMVRAAAAASPNEDGGRLEAERLLAETRELTGYAESEHFHYRFLEGGFAEERIVQIAFLHEGAMQKVSAALKVEPPLSPIVVYLLNDAAPIDLATSSAFPDQSVILETFDESMWSDPVHEVAHVLARVWTREGGAIRPSPAMREGLAVWLDGRSDLLHREAARIFMEKRLPAFETLLAQNPARFLHYALAGSFVSHIAEKRAVEGLRKYYAAGLEANQSDPGLFELYKEWVLRLKALAEREGLKPNSGTEEAGPDNVGARNLFEDGRAAICEGDWAAAPDLFRKAAELAPNDGMLWFFRWLSLSRTGAGAEETQAAWKNADTGKWRLEDERSRGEFSICTGFRALNEGDDGGGARLRFWQAADIAEGAKSPSLSALAGYGYRALLESPDVRKKWADAALAVVLRDPTLFKQSAEFMKDDPLFLLSYADYFSDCRNNCEKALQLADRSFELLKEEASPLQGYAQLLRCKCLAELKSPDEGLAACRAGLKNPSGPENEANLKGVAERLEKRK